MEGTMKRIHKEKGREIRGKGLKENQRGSLNGNQRANRGMLFFKKRFLQNVGGFGMNELLGIAAALIIAGLVIIPGLSKFAQGIMKGLNDWWDATISKQIFPTSAAQLVQQIFPSA